MGDSKLRNKALDNWHILKSWCDIWNDGLPDDLKIDPTFPDYPYPPYPEYPYRSPTPHRRRPAFRKRSDDTSGRLCFTLL